MRKKYCISIDESIMMMLEELTDIIIPFTKLSKSSATEYCIRSTYEAIRKADENAEKKNKQSS